MFRTITAKFPGTCKRCLEAINPGDRMRYGGRGRTYHLKADCSVGKPKDDGLDFRGDPRAEFGYDGRQMGYYGADLETGDF